ncbi:MAG: hypothetical protein ACR2JB_17910 [Bryobacteraceae bacterium]
MKSEGTGQSQIGNNTTKSTPFVTVDGWAWFQGTDDKLWKVFAAVAWVTGLNSAIGTVATNLWIVPMNQELLIVESISNSTLHSG